MYEGLFIFPEVFQEEQLDAALDAVKKEIEAVGGEVDSSTRLGRRSFAREIKKQNAGLYTVIRFNLDGSKVVELRERLKFNPDIFRMEIYRAELKPAVEPAE